MKKLTRQQVIERIEDELEKSQAAHTVRYDSWQRGDGSLAYTSLATGEVEAFRFALKLLKGE